MLVTRGQESVTNDLVIIKQCFFACTATPFGYDWRTLDEGRVMKGLRRFVTVSHEGQSRPYVYAYDYDALLAERDELLVALQACVDYGSMTGDESITDNAIAAIAKARGDV